MLIVSLLHFFYCIIIIKILVDDLNTLYIIIFFFLCRHYICKINFSYKSRLQEEGSLVYDSGAERRHYYRDKYYYWVLGCSLPRITDNI